MLLGRVSTGWRILRRNQHISRLRQRGGRCRLFLHASGYETAGVAGKLGDELNCSAYRCGVEVGGRLGIREDGDSEREGFPVITFFD